MFPTTAPPQVGRDMARIISWQRIVDFQLRNRSHLRLVLYNILRCLSVCSQYVNWAGLSRSFIHLLPLSLTGGGAREPITGLTYREQTTIRTQSQIRVVNSPIREEPTQTGQGFGAIGFLSLYKHRRESIQCRSTLLICKYVPTSPPMYNFTHRSAIRY